MPTPSWSLLAALALALPVESGSVNDFIVLSTAEEALEEVCGVIEYAAYLHSTCAYVNGEVAKPTRICCTSDKSGRCHLTCVTGDVHYICTCFTWL